MIEIEAKFRVDDHEPFRARLREAGAQCVGCVLERNSIFDDSDRTLLANDSGLRVRAITVLDGAAQTSSLTFKGPRTDATLKTRREIETGVDDPGAARELLQALGFVEVLVFEKRRETWTLGACRVELDTLPRLGPYVEIEGPDEAAINSACRAIGLDAAEHVRDSYIALLIHDAKARGVDTSKILFDNA